MIFRVILTTIERVTIEADDEAEALKRTVQMQNDINRAHAHHGADTRARLFYTNGNGGCGAEITLPS